MRPLLAVPTPTDLSSLPFPLYSSEKLDGIRCLVKNSVALSRTLKPIRNRYIQHVLGRPEFNGLDGELTVGDPNASDVMRVTNSGVMSAAGEPDFTYNVIDIWDRPGTLYHKTLAHLKELPKHMHIKVLQQRTCHTVECIEEHERKALDEGYEGLILRRPDAPYKFGRSTVREGYLFKLKRYLQEEAVVIGYEPWYHNANDSEVNELGYIQRPSNQDGKIELPLLGALIVEGKYKDSKAIFNIGTGFTLYEREMLWRTKENLPGSIVTYKFFPTGSKDKPRHPVFVSFRDESDL